MLRVLQALPWSLAIGDIEENLEGLLQEADVHDLTAHKILQLLRLGWNRQQIKDAIMLFRDVHWSTLGVEQAHGSAAVMHRHHTFSTDMLAARSFLHQCRHLAANTPVCQDVTRKDLQVQKLERKGSGLMSGRHLFLQWLMKEVKQGLPQGALMSVDLRKEVMRQHAGAYAALSPQEQAYFQQRSQAENERKRRSHEEDLQHLRDALRLARARATQELDDAGLMHAAANLRFVASDWQALATLAADEGVTWPLVQELRRCAMAAPSAPPVDVQSSLAAVPVMAQAEQLPERPEWLPVLCWNREQFRGAVLLTSTDTDSQAFYFLYATQSPLKAFFLDLRVSAKELPSLANLSMESAWAAWNESCDISFTMKLNVSVSHEEFAGTKSKDLLVLEHVTLQSATTAQGYGRPVPLDEFLPLASRRSGSARSAAAGPRAPRHVPSSLLEEHAWAAQYINKPQTAEASTADVTAACPEDSAEEASAFEDAWLSLEEARTCWRQEPPPLQAQHFVTCLRSGDWTAANRFVNESDRIIAQAMAGPPRTWCKRYGLNTMASFSFSRYTETGCHTLALEWCRRLQFFFDIWRQQDDPTYVYSDSDLQAYSETEEWKTFLASIRANPETNRRVEAIRCLLPTNPSS